MPPFFMNLCKVQGFFCKFTTKLEQKNQLTPGLGTFCPPTADGGAKAGFKVQRLTPGQGTVLPGKPALGLNFALKFNKPLQV